MARNDGSKPVYSATYSNVSLYHLCPTQMAWV